MSQKSCKSFSACGNCFLTSLVISVLASQRLCHFQHCNSIRLLTKRKDCTLSEGVSTVCDPAGQHVVPAGRVGVSALYAYAVFIETKKETLVCVKTPSAAPAVKICQHFYLFVCFFSSLKWRWGELSGKKCLDRSTALLITLRNATSLSGRREFSSKWLERGQLPCLMRHENRLPLNQGRTWHLSGELQYPSMQTAPSICCSNYDSSHRTTKTQGGQSLNFQRRLIYPLINSFSVAAHSALCTQSQPGWGATALHRLQTFYLFVKLFFFFKCRVDSKVETLCWWAI